MRYIVEQAEPWMGGWLAYGEVDGKSATNEHWHETAQGALGGAMREVAAKAREDEDRRAKEAKAS